MKQYLIKTATEKSNNYRYFTKHEIKAMLKVEDFNQSHTYKLLSQLHDSTHYDKELETHIHFLKSIGELYDDHNSKCILKTSFLM
jgi:DNA-binding transcriptional MerR regulator